MATSLPNPPRGRYLRYRFDTPAQLRRHCQLVDGRVLIFFPDRQPDLIPGSRAMIELCFSGSEQQVALPSRVRSRELRPVPGHWLELRALSVVAGLQSAVGAPRRQQRRLAFDQLAWVSHDQYPVLACPVLDLSRGGARLWGIPWPAAPGEALRVRVPYEEELDAQVAWARGREAGVTFAESSLEPAGAIYRRVEAAWAAARVAVHDQACDCTHGAEPLDPPFPEPEQLGGGLR